MAGDGDGDDETEYESDPEEAKMSLKMRRREASDDEDVDEGTRSRVRIADSEGESEGGVAEYNEEEDEGKEEEEYYDEQEEDYEVDVVEKGREIGGGGDYSRGSVEAKEGTESGPGMKAVEEGDVSSELMGESQSGGEEEKKVNEPFAVPTSGAFYMHDDRFRDNAAGGNHRTFGGRRLWQSKDDKKWGHDKFEELNVQNRHYDEGRRFSKSSHQGRGKGRGGGRGYARGNKVRAYGGNNDQNSAPKDVRGRGPRRYQPSIKNKSETLPSKNRKSSRPIDNTAALGRNTASAANSNRENEQVAAKKIASNLNFASPPFYPSGSSSKDIPPTQKEEVQAGNHYRKLRPSVVDSSSSLSPSNSLLRGKTVVGSIGLDKLHIDDSVSSTSARSLKCEQLTSSASSTFSTTKMPQSRVQGRSVSHSGSSVFQPPQTTNQINKVHSSTAQSSERKPIENRGQAPLQVSGHQLGQCSLDTSHGSPRKQGKGTAQGSGRDSLIYAGSQVMGSGGNMGAGHGDQNLPAFFPVMQLGTQHPGGMGVPAVGMAFPGYVGRSDDVGNSEMTWLPVLASAAGALGGTYCPPYMAVDGGYNPHSTGKLSALPAPSKDGNLVKPDDEVNPSQTFEVSNDEFSQRQNKARRYSEMRFSQ